MKKIIFTLFAACFLLFQGIAQITINRSDVAIPLTKYLQFNDTLPASTILPGNPGANHVWNFTALQHHTTDTIIFTKSLWTPAGSSFTNSDLCMMTINNVTNYTYMTNTDDSLSIVGQAENFQALGAPVLVALNPALKLMNFPSSYLSFFTDTSRFKVVAYYGQYLIDSVKVKDITTTQSVFDAWGSLTTSIGTFDCLRQNVSRISQDSVWVKNNFIGIWYDVTDTLGRNDTTRSYSWWAKNIGYLIAQLNVDPVSDSVFGATYLGTLPQPGSIEEMTSNNEMGVYPNPTSGMISVFSNRVIKTLEIYNLPGELVQSENLNSSSGNINISNLPEGIYFIRLYDREGGVVRNRKFVVR